MQAYFIQKLEDVVINYKNNGRATSQHWAVAIMFYEAYHLAIDTEAFNF